MAIKKQKGAPPADDIKKTSINFSASAWKKAKIYCVNEGTDLGQMIADAIEEYLRRRGVL